MADEKRIEVTNQNALKLAVGLLDIMVSQNKVIIERLGSISGSISKLANVDLGASDGPESK
jgi:hypothetical protein